MSFVQADLTEQHRERLTAHLTFRGIALRDYTFDPIRTSILELVCAPRLFGKPFFPPKQSAKNLLCTRLRWSGRQYLFLGNWQMTGQEGFVQEFEEHLFGPWWSLRRLGRPTLQGRTATGEGLKERPEKTCSRSGKGISLRSSFEVQQKEKCKPKGLKGKTK